MLYFSGTGNSKYVAEMFCHYMNKETDTDTAESISIEDNTNFSRLINSEEVIAFCYPVYSSRVPRIMRDFALKYKDFLEGKKIIILCTQMLFSGDGARAFTDLFPGDYFEVIYAEHFLMPNNICNVFLVPLASKNTVKRYLRYAERKMKTVCENINAGIIKKRGFNIFSRLLGLPQGYFWPAIEEKIKRSVRINDDCTQCGRCFSSCPMNNLTFEKGEITHKSNCLGCYRCVNDCQQKAITAFFHARVKRQYEGLD